MVVDDYLVGSCTLHNLQTALRNAVTHVLADTDGLKFKILEDPMLTR